MTYKFSFAASALANVGSSKIDQKQGETIGDIKAACLKEIARIQEEMNKTMFLAKNE